MTDYVDAGEAIDYMQLSAVKGSAPATGNVDYERILDARSEPQNWLTYYGTYDGQRYSDLDQINKENVRRLSPAWVFQAGSVRHAVRRVDLLVRGLPDRRRRRHVRLRPGRQVLGPGREDRRRSSGGTSTPPRTTSRCAAATSTAGWPWRTGRSTWSP